MSLPTNRDQLERTKFVEDTDGKVAVRTLAGAGGATIYAVVNTGAAGVQDSLVTLNAGPNQIGSVTVANPVQLAAGTNYIGLASVNVGNTVNALLQAGTNYIGLASVNVGNTVNSLLQAGTAYVGLASVNIGGSLPALSTGTNFIGLATVNIGSSNTVSATFGGNVTLNPSPNFIGLATINIGSSNATLFAVVNTAAAGVGNSMVTLLSGPNQIGSVTVSNPIQLATGTNYVGLASVNIGGTLPALTAGTAYIGLASVNIGGTLPALAAGTNYIGLASVNVGGTLPALVAGTAYIGLVTAVNSNQPALVAGTAYVGLASVNVGGTLPALSAGAAYIGLATVVPSFGSNVTVFTGIYSAAGAATIFVAPASNRFFLTSLHVSSLGRSEVEFRSGATTIIPFTSLATTGGYIHDWSMPGYPARAQADAFVANLGSAATISVGVACYFQP